MTKQKAPNDNILVSGFLNNIFIKDQGKSALAYLSIKDGTKPDGNPAYRSISLEIFGGAVQFLQDFHLYNLKAKQKGEKVTNLIQIYSGMLSSFKKGSKTLTILKVFKVHILNHNRVIVNSMDTNSISKNAENDKITVSGYLSTFKLSASKSSAMAYLSIQDGKKDNGSNDYKSISLQVYSDAKKSLEEAFNNSKTPLVQITSGMLTSYDDKDEETRTYLKGFKAQEIHIENKQRFIGATSQSGGFSSQNQPRQANNFTPQSQNVGFKAPQEQSKQANNFTPQSQNVGFKAPQEQSKQDNNFIPQNQGVGFNSNPTNSHNEPTKANVAEEIDWNDDSPF